MRADGSIQSNIIWVHADERFVYFASGGPGPMIEVTEVLPAKAEAYRAMAEAAHTYDGSDPVREGASLGRR